MYMSTTIKAKEKELPNELNSLQEMFMQIFCFKRSLGFYEILGY